MDKTQPCGGCNRGSSPRGDTMNFSTPVEKIPRVGTAYQKKLERLKIKTVGDLLYHFPVRYEDFSTQEKISNISSKGSYTILAAVVDIDTGYTSQKRLPYAKATLKDSSGDITAVWFYQPYLSKTLKEGELLLISGNVNYTNSGLQFINPFFEKVKSGGDIANKIVAVYPETEGVSSKWLRYIIRSVLNNPSYNIVESLPSEVIKERNLYSLKEALKEIHFPSTLQSAKKAQRRISFERVFLLQLFLLKQKIKIAEKRGVPIKADIEKVQELVKGLPFTLTDDQKKVSWQILKDLEKSSPMNRLLEGDVGSGKTIVAVIASLIAIKAGYQVALMAPTEVLSRQHFDNIAKLLFPFKIDTALLTGKKDLLRHSKLKGDTLEISREKIIEKIKSGDLKFLIGTHALIQDKVKFKNLALVILDEQHRFGVEQRAKLCLKESAGIPHLLSMTATPIPRTLALTVYGDLHLSVISQMPKERKKIITKIVPPKKREDAYQFVREQIKEGRQVFFICPKIEEKETYKESPWSNLKSVEEEGERLSKEVFPDLKVSTLHGRMKSSEKEKIMKDFHRKKSDILVSTSVIEVGIDIKNASVIIIEAAEMFGLAQLHQFRGRVGRGEFQSYCFLFTNSYTPKTKARLRALLTSKNGFELAEKDLEIRGPGDFLGKRQWGSADFTMEALKDRFLVEEARETAKNILNKDKELTKTPLLKKRVEGLKTKLHLE